MAGTYTRWYRVGTVSVSDGGTVVTGKDTYWLTAGLNPGDIFSINGINDYEILSITDNTHITLSSPYDGVSVSNSQYHIIRNFTSHMPSQLAAALSELYGDLNRYWAQDTQTLTGASAYDIAKRNGYNGTEAQWVDYLRNGGGFTDLMSRTDILSYDSGFTHNAFFRGKALGDVTTNIQKWSSAIKSGKFTDLYPGDSIGLYDGSTRLAYGSVLGCTEFASGTFGGGAPKALCCTLSLGKELIGDMDGKDNSASCVYWNKTQTYEGGLLGSYIYSLIQPGGEVYDKLIPLLGGEDHVVAYNYQVADSCDSNGNYNHYVSREQRLFLPSFPMLYGNFTYGTAYPQITRQVSAVRYRNLCPWNSWSDLPFTVFHSYTGARSTFTAASIQGLTVVFNLC